MDSGNLMHEVFLSLQEFEADRIPSTVEPLIVRTTIGGLHEFPMRQVVPLFIGPETKAVDFGTETGALVWDNLVFVLIGPDR